VPRAASVVRWPAVDPGLGATREVEGEPVRLGLPTGQGEGSRAHRRRRTTVGRRWGGAATASVIGQASMEGGD
jgi:hypothetical protein